MKPYLLLGVLCYVVLLLLPLLFLPAEEAGSLEGGNSTTVTIGTGVTDKQDPAAKPADVGTFKVLDANAGVIYTFAGRDFLIYTLAAEVPVTYHEEALKAQAVAAFTYYTYEKQHNKASATLQGADTSHVPTSFPARYSPEGLKTLWGDAYENNLKRVAAAVDAVLGEQILYEGQPILAMYHHGNWGRTETAETVWGKDYPYLQSVVSTGDHADKDCTSTVTLTDKAFAEAFSELSLTGDAAEWISGKPAYSEAGSVTALTVGGKVFDGNTLRTKLGLRSACFTVSHGEEGFTFLVKGFGHGVGLSQCGANAMAQQGFSYKEILQHYYTGVTVENSMVS